MIWENTPTFEVYIGGMIKLVVHFFTRFPDSKASGTKKFTVMYKELIENVYIHLILGIIVGFKVRADGTNFIYVASILPNLLILHNG